MSFKTISANYRRDTDFHRRTYNLLLRQKVLNGTFYDVLRHQFADERNEAGEYIPLAHRQPSSHMGTNILRTVVKDGVNMTFGDGKFPMVDTQNVEARQAIAAWIKDGRLQQVMKDASTKGSVGSVAIILRALDKNGRVRVFPQVMETAYLTPKYDPDEPDVLLSVTHLQKLKGDDLFDMGYDIAEDDLPATFWFKRVWDTDAETWFLPWTQDDVDKAKRGHRTFSPKVDKDRTAEHHLGFCPIVWMTNLVEGDGIDGVCTFDPGLEDALQIDTQISQGGRGLRYAADPLLLIKEPAMPTRLGQDGMEVPVEGGGMAYAASPATVLTVDSEKGDAKFLEITGAANEAVLSYCRELKMGLIETLGGDRLDMGKLGAGPRGSKALEMVNSGLVALADGLRASYGEHGLLPLIRMFLRIALTRDVWAGGAKVPMTACVVLQDDDLSLRWGAYYPPNSTDLQTMAQGMATLIINGVLSRETATKLIAPMFDIEAVDVERALIAAEIAANDARMKTLGAQVQDKETGSAGAL